ncbi:hypothetical protein VTJ04DRAFT_6404 [Mycothermus thermophilus]|uniref:uncharacterized protein n=1 Tax=Humicola insolens TaxID=85995 RepID=UPI003742EAAA
MFVSSRGMSCGKGEVGDIGRCCSCLWLTSITAQSELLGQLRVVPFSPRHADSYPEWPKTWVGSQVGEWTFIQNPRSWRHGDGGVRRTGRDTKRL